MKNVVYAVAMVIGLIGCSKESEIALSELNQDRVELNVTGSFVVGTVDASGAMTITYDAAELAELAACAVSEDAIDNLELEHVPSVGYFLSGVASSTGSYTTFSIKLSLNDGDLSWEDNAEIFTCLTTSSTPCELEVQSAETFDCNNSGGACGSAVIGGEGGTSYDACNWPWQVPQKTKGGQN
jgi:hypothetical protein